jgi:hypothetical protein
LAGKRVKNRTILSKHLKYSDFLLEHGGAMLRRNPPARWKTGNLPRDPSGHRPGMAEHGMSQPPQKRKGALALGEIVGRVIEPVTARRGFAKADLIAVWPEIAGPMHAASTAPEKIVWPRHHPDAEEPPAGTLFIRADGPRAIFVQHELPQIVERVNAFFGYRAVGQARVVQGPVTAATAKTMPPARLDEASATRIAAETAAVDDDRLREALERLGRGVFTNRRD